MSEQTVGRLETLRRLAGEVTKTRAIVELGVNRGKSLVAMAEAAHGPTVYGIDLWDMAGTGKAEERWRASRGFADPAAFAEFLQAVEHFEDKVVWVKGDSAEIAKVWTRPIGLLHIDGAHDYVSVKRDYEGWAPHIVKGGWLCLDDAQHEDKVGRLIEKVIVPSGLWHDWEMVATAGRQGVLAIARRV